MDFPILSTLIFLPIVLSVFVVFARSGKQAKISACLIALFNFILSLVLMYNFDKSLTIEQFVEFRPWISALGLDYSLGVDGLGLVMILLTNLLSLLSLIYSPAKIENPRLYFTSFLLLQALAIALFASYNALMFYIVFEAMLIPMFLIIGIWGGENRLYAAFKFFLYTLAGSVLFLVSLIYIYLQIGTFNILEWPDLISASFTFTQQCYLFVALFIAFAIKIPMFGFHTWLPDAHVQAPTAGSVMLAGVLLKVGAFAMLRFIVPMFEQAVVYFSPYIMGLSAVGIIYASIVAYNQTDIKKMIAYSSIAHMGFITLGIFSLNELAVQGAIMQMINHGIVSAGLFFAIGVIYSRLHTRNIHNFGSLANHMPRYAFVVMVLMLASIGLPGTANFAGEITILLGSYPASAVATLVSVAGVLLGATYMLKLYKAMFYEKTTNEKVEELVDLSFKETIVFLPLVVLVVILGFLPNLVFDYTQTATQLVLHFFK